ncbi:MarR family transcriptional regulator [Pradoshia sp. D12]|uniref:MarR family winged helix-turn-helix transcriptional regulator n=1 Tax=Bacillaceae TaxID=186817 RepID=UPI001124A2B0|nr:MULTISPECIES: MarR family transcriptional regulator [Bacillaceae]QFK71406.1 MarR family transcriptional regulator [Pradoshia sp. D12]TPF73201.1 MarR family transcriptional regulator [Bacillus sp. D12]
MEKDVALNKQLCFVLYETTNEFTRLYSNVLKPFGLTYPQYLVLLSLWEQDQVPMKELGQKLNMGTGTLNPIISRMQQSGWLIKERSKTDERMMLISLQEKAYKQKNNIIDSIKSKIEECGLEIEEYQALMEYVNKLNAKLKSL